MRTRRPRRAAGVPLVAATGLLLLAALTALAAVLTIASLSEATYELAPDLAVATVVLAAAGTCAASNDRRRLPLLLVPIVPGGVTAWMLLHVASTAFDAQGPGLEGAAVLAMIWTLVWCVAGAATMVPPPRRATEKHPT